MAVTENKVTAGAAGAGGAVVTANFLLYLLAVVTKHPIDPTVAMFVNSAVAYGAAYLSAWLAPHTPRPDLAPPVEEEPAAPPVEEPVVIHVVQPELPADYPTQQLPQFPL